MISKDGKLAFKVLEKQDVEVSCDQGDTWVQTVLRQAAPNPDLSGMSAEDWAKSARYQATIMGSRLVAQSEYQLNGTFEAEVPAICGRCGEAFRSPRQGNFHVYFQLVDDEKAVEDSGDPDLIMTDSGEMDVKNVLAEQLVVAEPMVEQHPEGSCEAVKLESEPSDEALSQAEIARPAGPFAGLKGLKLD